MAQDAELKLKVSLDLAFFRAQLSRLPIEAAGYSAPINLKINQKSIADQYRLLNKYFGKKEFRIEVNSNLESEIKNAGRLVRALQSVQKVSTKTTGGLPLGTGQLGIRKPAGGLGVDEIKKLFNASIQAGLLDPKTLGKTREQMVTALGSIGRDSIEGLLNGLDGGNAKVRSAAESLGKDLIAATKNVLGIASPSKIFDALGRFTAEGFDDGFTKRFKEFKGGAIAEVRQFISQLRAELAKAAPMGGGGGSGSGAAWRQFLQDQAARPRGGRAYTAPIGPLPMGSQEPWAAEGGGYTPRLASSTYQRPAQLPSEGMLAPYRANPSYADPNSFLAFSRRASQIQGRIGGGGVVPGGGFPSEGMMYPSSQLPAGYNALGTLPEKLKQASEFLNRRQLPLTEGIKNLASEFGNATTQVLLFGTAYKALAFLTSLPGQAFNAAKGLETFKNQLEAVTQSTGQFGPSVQFINDSVKQLNIPLNSAREGFVRLFASLQPAGFDPKTIQNLFSGITKASATFGLSADQVDRVFYAFGQMASKGQVMSEELKGQLGDVLPGSVALFAEAAQMSMTDFTKALEDGMFKGDAMRVLLENVAVLMSTKFSDAASKASKTLQGQMNAMQNSMQLMYESLQPVVNSLAATFGPIIQKTIQDATDVITAFNLNLSIGGDSFELMSEGAQNAYQALSQLVPSIQATFRNIGRFTEALKPLGSMLGIVIKAGLDFLSIPFVARLAAYSVIIGTLTTAFQFLVNTGIIQAIAAMIRFIATLSVTQIQAMIAGLQNVIARLITMVKTLDLARLGVMALKVSLVTLGVGAVILGLDLVAQKLLGIGDSANKARQSAAALTDELNRAVEAGDTAVASAKYVEAETEVQSIQQAQKVLQKLKGGQLQLSKAEYQKLQDTNLASGINYQGGIASFGQGQLEANIQAAQQGYVNALNKAGQAREAMGDATQVAVNRQRQTEASRANLKAIPPGGEGGDGGSKPKMYISTKSPEIEAELNRRLAAVEANANLDAREKELRKANLTEFAKHAIAKEELNARLLQIEKAGYVNRQKAIDDANATYQKSIGQATLEKEKVLFGPILDAIESETKATALAAIQQELYGNAVETNNDLLEAEYLIRTTLDVLKGKDAKRGQELAQILRDQIKLRIQDANATKYQKTVNEELLKPLQNEIALLRAVNDEERRRLEILQKYPNLKQSDLNKVMDLAKVRDNIKQVRALIDDFVTSTSSDYKGFLKAVISGEDAVDALEKFQAGLKDRVLTIFLDFTMKPVEDFFKNVAGGKLIESLFPKTEEEKQKEAIKTPMDANTEATKTNTTAIDNLTKALGTAGGGGGGQQSAGMVAGTIKGIGPGGLMNPTSISASDLSSGYGGGQVSDVFATAGINLQDFTQSSGGFVSATQGISSAMGDLSNISVDTANNLSINMDAIKDVTNKAKDEGNKFVEQLGGVVQGIGMVAGAAMSIVAGIEQVQKGGTKNTIAGIGSILMGVGGSIFGFGKIFGLKGFASGGIATGGFRAFANGGTVSGPTLGLVGEGKYNEAIVPLPDGRSIPVQMQGNTIRDKMAGNNNGGSTASPVLSMNFETTTINNVEYVSREQLEKAMMETRKLATRDGARQGANLAIDKIQQSPNTRRRIGI